MTSPMDILLSKANMKCMRCSAPMGTCACWEQITLRCPKCGRTKKATKEPHDPLGTVVVEYPCDKPKCDVPGDRPETHYYDAQGRWFNGEKFVRTPRVLGRQS